MPNYTGKTDKKDPTKKKKNNRKMSIAVQN